MQGGLAMDHPSMHYSSYYTFTVLVHFQRYTLQKIDDLSSRALQMDAFI